jgi:hypothetical protein
VSSNSSIAEFPDWISRLEQVEGSSWADFVSKRDSRFAAFLPRGQGTVTERVERCLADPTSSDSVIEGSQLAASIEKIQEAAIRIEQQSLEASLLEILEVGSK